MIPGLRRAVAPSLAALVVLGAAACAGANGARGPRLAVEPASFDFGNVRPARTLQKEVALRNFGDTPLEIEKVSTSCGCTVVGAYATRIAPGEGTTLRVSFTTPETPGRAEETVRIQTSDPERPVAEVKVSATVVAEKRGSRAGPAR